MVKAYDVRGLVPDELDERAVSALAAAFVEHLGADRVVVGHDMRATSPSLAGAFAAGAISRGADVVEIGLASTDLLYYASGVLAVPGAMITASHNPARYNGVKLCRAAAAPVGRESGLEDVRRAAEAGLPPTSAPPGRREPADLLGAYAAHVRSLVPGVAQGRPLRVVVDAGNGMAGHTLPAVLDGLPHEVTRMYWELDGTFPHHEANPIDPATLVDLVARVRADRADLGLAFDGDADRCFAVDETGAPVSPSALTALIAERELARSPGSAVVHNLITSRTVPEVVTEAGGTPVRTRVGHSYVKATMAGSGAVFGGEHSGHFYFRDFWNADSGVLAALHLLAALAARDGPASALLARYDRYAASGEVNSVVPDAGAALAAARRRWQGRPGVHLDDLDGLTVELPDGAWFNLRPSNTEPLLRLNVEAADAAAVARLRDEVLAGVRGQVQVPAP